MKRIALIIATLAILLGLGACKTNNGDIGPWYGVWALDAIYIDGSEDTSWQKPGEWTNFAFQNNIVKVALCSDRTVELEVSYGTWHDADGKMTMDFTHHDDQYTDQGYLYKAPTWIYFEAGMVTTLNIDKLTGKTAVLSTTHPDGRKYTYHLRKTY